MKILRTISTKTALSSV